MWSALPLRVQSGYVVPMVLSYLLALVVIGAAYLLVHRLRKTKATAHGFWIVPLLAAPVMVLVMRITLLLWCVLHPDCDVAMPGDM